jgi:peptide/nickel transport system substrate-binding protein
VHYQAFDPASTKMIQAVAAQLQEVGVTLELKGATNFGEYVSDLMSLKYAGSVLNATGGLAAYLDAQFAYLPGAVLNPFGVDDPNILSAYNAVAAASKDDADAAAHAFTKVLVDEAVTLPVAQIDIILMFNDGVKGLEFQDGSTMPTPITSWHSN